MATKRFDPQAPPERFGRLPETRGLVFICIHCGRPVAVDRDAALRAWGERGVIAEAAAKLRCRMCKRRGMTASLAPFWAKLGSPTAMDKLLATIRALKPQGRIE